MRPLALQRVLQDRAPNHPAACTARSGILLGIPLNPLSSRVFFLKIDYFCHRKESSGTC